MPTIRLHLGDIRELTAKEQRRHPQFKYVVSAECICFFGDKTILIPAGFLTDGSTGGPDVGWSWLVHDYLYATQEYRDGSACTRKEADRIMYRLLHYERHYFYAAVYWAATKICACKFSNAWKKAGQRGPLMLDD